MTITSLALCLGFLVLTTAELKNQAEFGALTAASLAFACLTDVLLTPALCSNLRIVTLWDSLTLDLGAEPQRTIPLFRGLSVRQARIVCLLADVRSFKNGGRLFRTGDPGEEMYVVIDGELSAFLRGADGKIELATLGRGDVVGEVALFYGRRTADVEAARDTRVLRLTKASLDRLARRYPKIATVIMHNLTATLASRLAQATVRLA